MKRDILTFRTRFSNVEHFFPEAIDSFKVLLELSSGLKVEYENSVSKKVDIEIQSTLNEGGQPPLLNRFSRLLESKIQKSIDLSKPRNLTNQQPFGNARMNIFYSAENHRPPPGSWDAYLTFDTLSLDGRNAYFPLWWLTSTDLLGEKRSPFLGRNLTLKELTSPRLTNLENRDKFCAVFSGKAWPFRVHAINLLNQIDRVDVYGDLSRNNVKSKMEVAARYKFVLCFENDLYPGYVTEKLPEAWATGAIPLYWGDDRLNSFNKKAFLNLNDSLQFEDFIEKVKLVNENPSLWRDTASEPLLIQKPTLERVVHVIREAMIRKRLI